jgi:TonB family protein
MGPTPGSTTLSGVPRKDLTAAAPRPLNPKATIPPGAGVPPLATAHPPVAPAAPAPVPSPAPRETPREAPVREKDPSDHPPAAPSAGSSFTLGAGSARRGGGRSGPPIPMMVAGGVVAFAVVVGIVGFVMTRPKAAPAPESVATEAPPVITDAPPPPAPATPAPMSAADFTSKPDGADVAIAGNAVGQTPLLDYEVRSGSHAVTMSKAGYERWSGTAVVEAGKKAIIFAELRPIGGAPATAAPATAAPATPAPAVEKEYLENEVDVSPKPIAGAPVVFPPSEVSSQKPGSTVSVTVAFLIGADGSVSKVEIVGSGGKALDVAALSAIGKWKFSPGLKQGKSVKVRMTRKFSFKF